MDLETAIRSRRNVRRLGGAPLDRAAIEGLLDLARWAPNHHLSNPWRFRVVGPQTAARLRELAEAQHPGSGAKISAPTLVVVSAIVSDDPHRLQEDLLATGIAAYIVTLAAHGRGLASHWRSPAVLRTPHGRAAIGIEEGAEQVVGMIHLGTQVGPVGDPDRTPAAELATYLP